MDIKSLMHHLINTSVSRWNDREQDVYLEA